MKRNKFSIDAIYATDLNDFLACRHMVSLVNSGDEVEKETDEELKLYQTKGDEHEEEVAGEMDGLVRVDKSMSKTEKIARTVDLMNKGVSVIHGAYLKTEEGLIGEIDFLVRVEVGSPEFKKYSYMVMDAKKSAKIKPEYIVQLMHYSFILKSNQGVLPEKAVLIGGDKVEREIVVAKYIDYYRNLLETYREFMKPPLETEPYPISWCSYCQFEDYCMDELKRKKHVSLIAGIRRAQSNVITREFKINSMEDLARFDMKDFKKCRGLGKQGLGTLIRQAKAQTTGEIEVLESSVLSDFGSSSSGDLFFDMESDPVADEGRLEYLFGFWVREEGKVDRFERKWALSHVEEKQAFQDSVEFMLDFVENHPDAGIYHYGSYEKTHMMRLAHKYSLYEEEIESLIDCSFIDLYAVVKISLVLPVLSYSIKDLESVIGYEREGEIKGAGSSIVCFEKWLETGDKKYLDAIEAYNREDVEATAALYDWLLKVGGEDEY